MNSPIDFICFKVNQFHQTMEIENRTNSKPIKQWRLIGWTVPDKGWVKVNSDGAMKHDSGLAAAGGVLRDENGRWMCGFATTLGYCSSVQAKIWGAWYSLKLAGDKGYCRVVLELDNLNVVNWISKKELHVNSHFSLLKYITRMIDFPWQIKVQHIMREGNRSIDAMANLGINLTLGYYHFEVAPANINEIIVQDIVGVSFPRLCL